jgi:Zn-dependent metalloprotease
MWKVHLSEEGAVLGMSGSPVPIREADLPKGKRITEQTAIESAKKHHLPNELTVTGKASLYVYIHEKKPHYAWIFAARGIGLGRGGVPQPATLRYFVDAISSNILRTETLVLGESLQRRPITTLDYTGPNVVCEGSGVGIYCAGEVKFPTRKVSSSHDHPDYDKFVLIDDSGPTRVETYATNAAFDHTELSIDDDNKWNAKEQAIDVDAHVNSIQVKNYFINKFKRESFFMGAYKGEPMLINAIRGDGKTQWDPTTRVVNVALMDPDDERWNPLCDLDAVAHEWTHALLSDESVLVANDYVSMSASLREALCDAFAQFITNDSGWVRGRSVWKLTKIAEGARNMRDPTNGGTYDPSNPFESLLPNASQPDHMADFVDPEDCTAKGSCKYRNDCTTKNAPCWPSHINQGIINKATYLMAQGGEHSGLDVRPGMGVEMLELLYYECILMLPNYELHFDNFWEYLLTTLDKLFGPRIWRQLPDTEKKLAQEYHRFWKQTINNSFAAVGVIGVEKYAPIVSKPEGVVHWP